MGDITDLEHDTPLDDEEDEVPTTVKPRDAWWEWDERTNSIILQCGTEKIRVHKATGERIAVRAEEGNLKISPYTANLIIVEVEL